MLSVLHCIANTGETHYSFHYPSFQSVQKINSYVNTPAIKYNGNSQQTTYNITQFFNNLNNNLPSHRLNTSISEFSTIRH